MQMPGLLTGSYFEELGGGADPDRPYDLPTKCVSVQGTQLHYLELGDGDPVVFVHGAIGDYRTWGYQFESFASRHRVISYSMRYHYPNDPTEIGPAYSTSLHSRDLATMIDALDLGPVHLVGQSSGAAIAAICACHFPGKVRTLSVCEPSFYPWLLELDGGRQALEEFNSNVMEPGADLLKNGDTEGAVRTLCDGVLGSNTFSSMSPAIQSVMLDNAPALRVELNSPQNYTPFSFEDAASIAVPTLLVRGGGTLALYDKLAVKFAQLVPGIEVAMAPGAPHAVHFIHPEAFNRIVLDFLERSRAAR
jgi:pimeloyl-ACP methyl ester carboxylesterase